MDDTSRKHAGKATIRRPCRQCARHDEAMSVGLITGSSSGFGEHTARLLATHGHRVYASMRGVTGRNA
jgi:hypothetical protein